MPPKEYQSAILYVERWNIAAASAVGFNNLFHVKYSYEINGRPYAFIVRYLLSIISLPTNAKIPLIPAAIISYQSNVP